MQIHGHLVSVDEIRQMRSGTAAAPTAADQYFDVEAWRRCKDPRIPSKPSEALKLEMLAGRRCIVGVHLAGGVNIASLEYLFLPLGEKAKPDDPYIRIGRYFMPSETIQSVPAYQVWQAWAAIGLLDVTEGNIVDHDEIEAAIEEAVELFQVEQVAYDRFQATQLSTRLQMKDVPVVAYRPGPLNFSAPMKALDALTRSLGIIHGGDPVMEWQMSNVVARSLESGAIFPNKLHGRGHLQIENPVALMAALGIAMAENSTP